METLSAFWLVWNECGRAPTFKHGTQSNAEAEADRLARANPGQRFHVLRLVSSCRKSDVEWTRVVDEMPF